MSQLDFFDYITGITIGSIAAEHATELEKPWKPLIAMMIYGAITVGLTFYTIQGKIVKLQTNFKKQGLLHFFARVLFKIIICRHTGKAGSIYLPYGKFDITMFRYDINLVCTANISSR